MDADPSTPSTEAAPARAGQPWQDDEDERLVTRLSADVPATDVAAEFGRTAGAIDARAGRLLPTDDEDRQVRDHVSALRAHLRDPAYDWRTARDQRRANRPKRRSGAARKKSNSQRPFKFVEDDDLVTIAEAAFGSRLYHSILVSAKVVKEIDLRELWPSLVDRRADLMVWRDASLTIEAARGQAERELTSFRDAHFPRERRVSGDPQEPVTGVAAVSHPFGGRDPKDAEPDGEGARGEVA